MGKVAVNVYVLTREGKTLINQIFVQQKRLRWLVFEQEDDHRQLNRFLVSKESEDNSGVSDLDMTVFVLTLSTEEWSCYPMLSVRAVRLLLVSKKIVWIQRRGGR